ncbi:MAG: O-antigen ligase family protein [Thermodesulfobacteriota bacterium]
METIKNRLAGLDLLEIVRSLLLLELVALLVSTSLAVGTEFIIYLLFALSGPLRNRLWQAGRRQPMVLMIMVWAGILIVAALYSVAPAAETLGNLSSWRKLLLLPMAAAVFDSDAWKRRLVWALVLTATLGAVLSYFSWFSGVTLYKYPRGISIHNHATQGMMFAVSLFAIALLSRYCRPETKGWYYFLPLAGLVICSNLIFVTPGRSGYLVLLVLASIGAFFMAPGRIRYLLGLGIPLGMALLLFFSPVASQRIMQGVNEIRNYEQSAELTSMGIRVVMWKNTLEMVRKKPLFGYGTGGFSEAYRRQVEGQEGWQGQPVDDCHNQFLRIVAEQGLLGLAVFVLFIGAFFRQRVSGVFRIMGLGVLLAWCATSMFSAHFSTFSEGRFLYLWCGALLAGKSAEDKSIS